MRKRKGNGGGFTLIELLVVIAIISIIAIVAIPVLNNARKKAIRKEAMTNILTIASLLDKHYADGNFTYNDGEGACPGTKLYCTPACGTVCAGLTSLNPNADATDDLIISGDNYYYTVVAADGADADVLCESYTITATGCAGKIVVGEVLSLSSTGAKTGTWQ